MLDLKSKTLCLVSTLIGYEEGKAIVEKYDRIFLFPMFFKCHYHLHPLVKFERGIVN
jgi:putative effector of murein hydrolase